MNLASPAPSPHSSDIDSLSAVITISFEQESYTVMEGSSQLLQVCAHTTDRIKMEQHLTVNAVITQSVGATQGSYLLTSRLNFAELVTLEQFH